MTHSGYPRKVFGWILIGISLFNSFGNPQQRGFILLYPFHDLFGLSEERIRADSFLDILSLIPSQTPNRGVSSLCILSMTISGCPRKGIGRILVLIPSETPNRGVSSLCIFSMTLSGYPRKGFEWILPRASPP